jgi:hypothetical protein
MPMTVNLGLGDRWRRSLYWLRWLRLTRLATLGLDQSSLLLRDLFTRREVGFAIEEHIAFNKRHLDV